MYLATGGFIFKCKNMNIHLRKTEWEWREYFYLLKKMLKTFFLKFFGGGGGGGRVRGYHTKKAEKIHINENNLGKTWIHLSKK